MLMKVAKETTLQNEEIDKSCGDFLPPVEGGRIVTSPMDQEEARKKKYSDIPNKTNLL